MTTSKFNGIVILDAVPDDEMQTALNLKRSLQDIECFYANGLQVRYIRIKTMDNLEFGLLGILNEIQNSSLWPWLHLDGHGSIEEDGFFLADGSFCSWDQFKQFITPLNIATGLDLMLIFATCFGGSFANAIRVHDRAPVLGLIGPTQEITAGESENTFPLFYKTFFQSLSLKKAIEALNSVNPNTNYYGTTAKQFFHDVWTNYKNVQCTKQEVKIRTQRLYRKLKAEKLPRTPSVGELKRQIKSQEPSLFKKFRDTYFMFDIYNLNRNRFLVTYKKAELYAAQHIE